MHIDFFGLALESPKVTFHLWSPWRSTALEHRLFEVVSQVPGARVEQGQDERIAVISDPQVWRTALQGVSRVMKGWQEDGDPGRERRCWRWLIEADTDCDGYDHNGEPFCLWAFLRLTLDRGGLDEPLKGEDIDLEGFGLRVWPMNGRR
ncbi:MAG: hypothetical protein ACK4RK_08125 [Gemmataceae bacterium]